jgi:hypothetical protein
MVRRLFNARAAGWAAAPVGCSQDGKKRKIGEGLSLQSLPQMSRGFTHLPRGGEALPTDAIGID